MDFWRDLGIVDFGAFVVGTILVVLLPGPNSLYAFVTASRDGVAAGFRAALGILTGDTILMAAAVFGAASLLHYLPTLFAGLQLMGAAYLAWLGVRLVAEGRNLWRRNGKVAQEAEAVALAHADSDGQPEPRRVAIYPYRRALVISLLNPKAILFFFSFFVLFVAPDAPHPYLAFAFLGVTLQLISATYLTALILTGSRLHRSLAGRPRMLAAGLTLTGSAFLGFGAKLMRDALARVAS
ncbi:leucine efflux protein LeuE [Hydrogenophilus islandicus]